jgi:uncharacterized protein
VDPVLPPPGDHPSAGAPEVLRSDECWRLLRSHRVGRFAFVVDGWPVVLPVNYVIVAEDILIRTGEGGKLAAAQGAAQVALQADSTESLYRSGWSVLVFGRASEITDADELRQASALPLQPWASGERRHWIRIQSLQITGRRLPPAWRYPDAPR